MNFSIYVFIILFGPVHLPILAPINPSEMKQNTKSLCEEFGEMQEPTKHPKLTHIACVYTAIADKNAPFIFDYWEEKSRERRNKNRFHELKFRGILPSFVEKEIFFFIFVTGLFSGCPAVTQKQAEIENQLNRTSGYVLFIQEFDSHEEDVTCAQPPKIVHTQFSGTVYDEQNQKILDRAVGDVAYKANPYYEGDDESEEISVDENKPAPAATDENNSTQYSWFRLPIYGVSTLWNYLLRRKGLVEETKQPLLENEDGEAKETADKDSEVKHKVAEANNTGVGHLDKTAERQSDVQHGEISESNVVEDTNGTERNKDSTKHNIFGKLEDVILIHVKFYYKSSSIIWARYGMQNLYLFPDINDLIDDTKIEGLRTDEEYTALFNASPLYTQMFNTLKHVFSAYEAKYTQTEAPFLVPMQLVSVHDFVFYPWANATYSHTLYAPMWKSTMNNWRRIEKAARSVSLELGIIPLYVHSGTHGIMTFEGRELYLGKTKTNKLSPDGDDTTRVPNSFWKCLISEELLAGVVIATSNDPFAEEPEDICDEKVTCGNIGVSEKEIATGGFYCCALSKNLVQKIEIPKKYSSYKELNLKINRRTIQAKHKKNNIPYPLIAEQ